MLHRVEAVAYPYACFCQGSIGDGLHLGPVAYPSLHQGFLRFLEAGGQ